MSSYICQYCGRHIKHWGDNGEYNPEGDPADHIFHCPAKKLHDKNMALLEKKEKQMKKTKLSFIRRIIKFSQSQLGFSIPKDLRTLVKHGELYKIKLEKIKEEK